MNGKRSIKLLITLMLLAGFALLFSSSGCIFDPWPEPGSANDESTGGDLDSDTGGDGDADTDSENDGLWNGGDSDLIYCSAPSPSGIVTVVGVEGAIPSGDAVLVEGAYGQVSFDRNEDGSFAGRIEAESGAELFLWVEEDGEPTATTIIVTGTLEGDPIGDTIVDNADVPSPDGDGVVYIHGGGDWLLDNVFIVGGNVDTSAGSEADPVCEWSDCQFDLYIPALVDDEIDLFLVYDGENSGHSDSQTVVVPAP